MAGVLVNDSNEHKISSEIRKWKNKYLLNASSSFHSVDFFEDYIDNYRNKRLEDSKSFFSACINLIDVFLSIPFEAKVFYIDLPELRKKLGFNAYIFGKQNYLKDVINKDYGGKFLQPINTILEEFFCFHEANMLKTKKKGYICFESQREFDEQTIKTFHQTLHSHNKGKKIYKYGKTLLGIHFDTKASLCASLELADFIAYGSTQYLRNRERSKELTIKPERLKILLEVYKRVKRDRKIDLRNCTTNCIDELKRIYRPYRPQKKASK